MGPDPAATSTPWPKKLDIDPELVRKRFDLPTGRLLTLRGVSLLHIAVDYAEPAIVELLLNHGADPNVVATVDARGVGGQTPLFHAIGRVGAGAPALFDTLLARTTNLAAIAKIQDDVLLDPARPPTNVLSLTALQYAERYEHAPPWRAAAYEVAALRRVQGV